MSNGGMLVDRLVCERSDLIASAALVSGAGYSGPCTPKGQVSLLIVHGARDSLAPIEGRANASDEELSLPDVPHHAADRAHLAGCTEAPIETLRGEIVRRHWMNCRGVTEVDLWVLSDGGHTWPGAKRQLPKLGPTSTALDANKLILDFFAANPGRRDLR